MEEPDRKHSKHISLDASSGRMATHALAPLAPGLFLCSGLSFCGVRCRIRRNKARTTRMEASWTTLSAVASPLAR